MAVKAEYTRDDERDMAFMGFLTFLDRPKDGVADAIAGLARLGVSIKVITGDGELVARHVATLVGLRSDRVLTGRQLDEPPDEALWRVAENRDARLRRGTEVHSTAGETNLRVVILTAREPSRQPEGAHSPVRRLTLTNPAEPPVEGDVDHEVGHVGQLRNIPPSADYSTARDGFG